ncbi:MAG: hypothetical protein EPN97_00705 [Alphaproteobacteria bacterium]|nr:MAG: hypothetical protein EPN97_00705 [Alphaproteobacteria bacterium]
MAPKLPEFDSVEFLISRKFPRYSIFTKRITVPRLGSTAAELERIEKLEAEIDNYRRELLSKPQSEIDALWAVEEKKINEERRIKEEKEERARFFSQPCAEADLDYWSKMAHWSLDEAIALSFGKDPKVVNLDRIFALANKSAFADSYLRLHELTRRAKVWKRLYDPILPLLYITWAKDHDIQVPEKLTALIQARAGKNIDWKEKYDQVDAEYKKLIDKLQASLDTQKQTIKTCMETNYTLIDTNAALKKQLQEVAKNPVVLGTKEKDTLLKLVIGMAVSGYAYDPKAKKNQATAEIAQDLKKLGIPLNQDTVKKWLKEGAEILPRAYKDAA